MWIKKKYVYLQCNQKQKKMNMKKTVLGLLLVASIFNVSAQKQKSSVVKDTVLIGDSVTFVKIQEGKKFFAIYKGKKVRATKSDKGKKAFIIYNINAAGERRISKIYYNN